MAVKKKKPSRKSLRKKLEDLVKAIIKERDNNTCQKCGKYVTGSNCHASHVIPVSAGLRLAYEPMNLKVLCYHDHINWWHKNPIEAGEWFKSKFPERWVYLEEKKELVAPTKDYELEEMYQALKQREELAQLEQ